MRICVLFSSYEHSSSELRDHDPVMDPSRWLTEHEVELHFLHQKTSAGQVRELASRGFDVFINLCDGSADEDTAGIEVVRALEELGLPFTGAHSAFYDPTREETRRACQREGLLTPQRIVTHDASSAAQVAERLRFPMIVKHPHSFGSIGMTKSSRVETESELATQLDAMITTYGMALVEEFIEGREFTVLVAEPGEAEEEPRAFPPVEARFPEGETFKYFALKWIGYDAITWHGVEDEALAARLVHATRALFVALGGSGYARADIRVDGEGRIFFLEINPNCGVFYAPHTPGCADVILSRSPGGHVAFLAHLIACAKRRARSVSAMNA